jgi:hypothetical protein
MAHQQGHKVTRAQSRQRLIELEGHHRVDPGPSEELGAFFRGGQIIRVLQSAQQHNRMWKKSDHHCRVTGGMCPGCHLLEQRAMPAVDAVEGAHARPGVFDF